MGRLLPSLSFVLLAGLQYMPVSVSYLEQYLLLLPVGKKGLLHVLHFAGSAPDLQGFA